MTERAYGLSTAAGVSTTTTRNRTTLWLFTSSTSGLYVVQRKQRKNSDGFGFHVNKRKCLDTSPPFGRPYETRYLDFPFAFPLTPQSGLYRLGDGKIRC